MIQPTITRRTTRFNSLNGEINVLQTPSEALDRRLGIGAVDVGLLAACAGPSAPAGSFACTASTTCTYCRAGSFSIQPMNSATSGVSMRWIPFSSALCLALTVPASVLAQVALKPGNWELISTFKGLPFGGDGERTRNACLSAAALGTFPEKSLIDAAPPPSDDASSPASPQCEYAQVHRDGAKSTWTMSCKQPKASGLGSATMHSSQQVELHEQLEVSMGVMSRTIQHDVRARRIGECS